MRVRERGVVPVVDVAVDRLDWRDLAQVTQDAAAADVAGVQDQRHAAERLANLLAKLAVRVRDQPDEAIVRH